ncbi:MAG TPA: pyridoxamine 5'-phosphate oxidase family protein [Solirubrobacteraceae bacterium]|nr:pyridoxamine 5'-phosphate oxidase family protein [Solirubrobacteraceae bacterium]
MTAWRKVEPREPEFARRVRALFDVRRHKTTATLRADGSPRISGIEASFEEGELTFGSMAHSRKGADLRRDPRFALHSTTSDPVEGSKAKWPGEAKIAGRARWSRGGVLSAPARPSDRASAGSSLASRVDRALAPERCGKWAKITHRPRPGAARMTDR